MGSKHLIGQTLGQPGVAVAACSDGKVIDDLGHQHQRGPGVENGDAVPNCSDVLLVKRDEPARLDQKLPSRRAFPRGPAD